MERTILYIGGFQLPERNAAAQRVVGIAKGLRALGYRVLFLNSFKDYNELGIVEKEYFGFKCFEYKREKDIDYLFLAKTVLCMIKKIEPFAVIAYNYPAVSLNHIRKYCKANGIKCLADSTEWYDTAGRNFLAGIIKGMDTFYRMRYVQKRMEGVIAISRYLYDYYKQFVKTVLIPPVVDMEDDKWKASIIKKDESISFVYAGVPSTSKERLDLIVDAVEAIESENKICLNIVGITREQFINIYGWKRIIPESVVFWGRVEHQKALQVVKQSDWSIILRENTRLVKAGFPTKVVESISCGTPVIANNFSNIFEYLTDEDSICVESLEDVTEKLKIACVRSCIVNKNIFDYHNFLEELKQVLEY